MTVGTSLSEDIDKLLEQYLYLLDRYVALRASLVSFQATIHRNIARANFTADRGLRYGQDFYDSRLQASRRCWVSETTDVISPSFVIRSNGCQSDEGETEVLDTGSGHEDQGLKRAKQENHSLASSVEDAEIKVDSPNNQAGRHQRPNIDPKESIVKHDLDVRVPRVWEAKDAVRNPIEDISQEKCQDSSKTNPQPTFNQPRVDTGPPSVREKVKQEGEPRDPIRMFGLLVPPPLRTAQSEAITMVENIIPQLLGIDARMKAVEIGIRRAQKHRAKAESGAGSVGLRNNKKSTEPAYVHQA